MICNECSTLVSPSLTTAARRKFLRKNIRSFLLRKFYASTLRGGKSWFLAPVLFVNETVPFIVYTKLPFYLSIQVYKEIISCRVRFKRLFSIAGLSQDIPVRYIQYCSSILKVLVISAAINTLRGLTSSLNKTGKYH